MGLNGEKEFKSLKCIDFEYITLYPAVLHAIKDNFVQIQEIKLKHCKMIDGDLYECLLKQASKLKVLRVEVCFESNMMIGIGNDWLCYQYPGLQHLDLRGVNAIQQIDELITFFGKNPNILKLELDHKLFRSNRRVLLESAIKLNVFAIEVSKVKQVEFDAICNQLNELYKHDFYKNLHLELYFQQPDKTFVHKIGLLQKVEKIFVWTGDSLFDGNLWPAITTLKELNLSIWIANRPLQNIKTLAINLVNLERIIFNSVHPETIYTIFRYSAKLKSVRFEELYNEDEVNINNYILSWNEARKELQSEWFKKFAIYVDEKYYLAAKWAAVDNLKYIEVRRDGYCPNHPFSDYRTIQNL